MDSDFEEHPSLGSDRGRPGPTQGPRPGRAATLLRGLPYDEQLARLDPTDQSTPPTERRGDRLDQGRGRRPAEPEERTRRAPETLHESFDAWKKKTDAMKRPEAERAGHGTRMVRAAEKRLGKLEWGPGAEDVGDAGCPNLPFIAAMDAGILTRAQYVHLTNHSADTDADGFELVLAALDFKPWEESPADRRYPTGMPKAGDVAIFLMAGAGPASYEHIALCTGAGSPESPELLSLQISYTPGAKSNPLIRTSVREYLDKLASPEARVVYAAFPY